ncbi:MAG: Na/Pi cotransporter family protein [Lentisphaeria bacterium]|nr:Na/Pi cotransporter family protein [Lentisphaeria bacterium]
MSCALEIGFEVLGGLGLFLLGMRHLSDGLQTIGGAGLRRMIGRAAENRFLATLVGLFVTMVIQSSSITTCLVVGFVNSGFMTLSQAIGVIMGANIGTTVTGWILTLKIDHYGLPLLGAAALVYLFSRRERVRYWALVLMGLGMIFLGLELMKNGFKPLRGSEQFMYWFRAFQAEDYPGVLKCALAGCVLTCIVQSSSATLGITIGLAYTGVIELHTAGALVLGENIGTTITAFLASLGTTTNARRAAYAHVLFNVIGVLWITAIFQPYFAFIETYVVPDAAAMVLKDGVETFPGTTAAIASVHTIFNVANTVLFLPLVRKLARVLEILVPEKKVREAPRLTALDVRLLESPALGVEQSRREILRMGEISMEMLNHLREAMTAPASDETAERRVMHREEVLDIMQKEVVQYMTHILSAGNVSHEVTLQGRRQMRMADEYESVGDYGLTIVKLKRRLNENGTTFTEEGNREISSLHEAVVECMRLVNEADREERPELIAKIHAQGRLIKQKARESRDNHLRRVSRSPMDPLTSVLFNDTVHAYQKINAHLMNIAEAMVGE